MSAVVAKVAELLVLAVDLAAGADVDEEGDEDGDPVIFPNGESPAPLMG